MRSQQRILAVLAVLLLGLVALLLATSPGTDAPRARLVWPALDPGSVRALQIHGSAGPTRLDRGPSGWTTDGQPADTARVDELVSLLSRPPAGDPLPAGVDPAELGLSPPRGQIRVEREGAPPLVVRVGRPVPAGVQTYVQREGAAPAVLRADLSRFVEASPGTFVDRRLFRVPAAAVERLEVGVGTLGWAMERRDGGWWVPTWGWVSPHRADDLVRSWLDLELEALGAPAEPLSDAPWFVVRLVTEHGHLEAQLHEPRDGRARVVTADGRTGSLLVEGRLRRPPRMLEVVEPYAFGIRVDAAERVEVTLGEATARLVRSGPRWHVAGAPHAGASDLLVALAGVRIDPARSPREPPERAWGRVVVEQGGTVREIQVGPPNPAGVQVVARPGEPAGRAVATTDLEQVRSKLAALGASAAAR